MWSGAQTFSLPVRGAASEGALEPDYHDPGLVLAARGGEHDARCDQRPAAEALAGVDNGREAELVLKEFPPAHDAILIIMKGFVEEPQVISAEATGGRRRVPANALRLAVEACTNVGATLKLWNKKVFL